MAGAPLGHIRFEMPAGRGRKARVVEQEVRAQRVMLPDRQGGQLEVTCLIASEVNAPAGTKPVVWRLLTNRVASTLQDAVELFNWYRARSEIELFFPGTQGGLPGRALAAGRQPNGCKPRWRCTWVLPGASTA